MLSTEEIWVLTSSVLALLGYYGVEARTIDVGMTFCVHCWVMLCEMQKHRKGGFVPGSRGVERDYLRVNMDC